MRERERVRRGPIVNRVRKAPLPVRDGLNPSRVRLPESGPWATTLEYLLQRFYGDARPGREKVAAGEVVDGGGIADRPGHPVRAGLRSSSSTGTRHPSARVPFEIEILHRDSDLLVVDKPHFLATMPRGLLHRRVGAGPVAARAGPAGPQPAAPAGPGDGRRADVLAAPRAARRLPAAVRARGRSPSTTRRSRRTGRTCRLPTHRAQPDRQGTGNADRATRCRANRTARPASSCSTSAGTDGLYGLHPATGKVHQLRLHMNSLGLPIRGDNFYPKLLDIAAVRLLVTAAAAGQVGGLR